MARARTRKITWWVGASVVGLVLLGVLLVWVWVVVGSRPKAPRTPPPPTVVVIKHAGNAPAAALEDGGAGMPPVYPSENPRYPRRGVAQAFQQVGVLVSKDAQEDAPILLALFGRKHLARDRWEYYVASDQYHMWKLPVQMKNRMCDEEVGCDEIYNGDEVVVPDYANKVFVARIYKYQSDLRA